MSSEIITVQLSGNEEFLVTKGVNCDIRNDGSDVIYASGKPGIVPSALGVLSIPAGDSAKLLDCCGKVYLLGTGSAVCVGNDLDELIFGCSGTAAVNAHASNADIHSTAEEKALWNTADLINPNLLTNPDFAINQRDAVSADNSIGADRWHGTYTVADGGGITFSETSQFATQIIENFSALIGRTFTATVWYSDGSKDTGSITASGGTDYFFTAERTHCTLSPENGFLVWASAPCTVKAVKLEAGGVSTMFCPPDPAAELEKCRRYFERISVPVSGFTAASQSQSALDRVRACVAISPKASEACTVTADLSSAEAVLDGSACTITGISAYTVSGRMLSIEALLGTSTDHPASGWISGITVCVSAEN